MSPEIDQLLERLAPYLALWSCAFTLIHSVRIIRRMQRGIPKVPDSALLTEAAALPLMLLQTVAEPERTGSHVQPGTPGA